MGKKAEDPPAETKDPRSELVRIKGEIAPVTQQAMEIVVKDSESAGVAADFITNATKQRKSIDEQRKFFTDPLNQQVKRINALFNEPIDILDQAVKVVKDKIKIHWIEEQRRAQAEAAKLQVKQEKKYEKAVERAEKKGEEAPPPPPPVEATVPAKTIAGGTGSAQVKMTWKLRVTNIGLLPLEYHLADEAKLRRRMQESIRLDGKPPEIIGVDFYQEPEVAAG